MGNKLGGENDEFEKMIRTMKHKQNQSAGNYTKITINPQQKYLSVMIQKLSHSNLPQQLKNKISHTLHQKLSKQQLIKTVSIANVLKRNQFDYQSSKSTIITSKNKNYQTDNVRFNFDFTKINPYIKKNLLIKSAIRGVSEITQMDLENYYKELTEQEKRKLQEDKEIRDSNSRTNLELSLKILKQEIKKMYHPFWKLNKAFADYVSNEFSQWLQREQSGCKKDSQRYQLLIRKLLAMWCLYLQQGCLYPYKKWLVSFLQLPQPKITKSLHSMLLQQIFSINNFYLYHSIMMLITQHHQPPNINFSLLQQQQDLITPELFLINDKLQIQGNYFISNYQCSELETMVVKPQKILKQLELLKLSICKDIDLFHRNEQRGQFYEIDSDNILGTIVLLYTAIGIVNYILTRIPYKIDGIYKQIILLRIVYGDGVYHSCGMASYMLSTLSGSMEFLQSEEFMRLLKENPLASQKPISPPTTPKESDDLTTEDDKTLKQSLTLTPSTKKQPSPKQMFRQFLKAGQKK